MLLLLIPMNVNSEELSNYIAMDMNSKRIFLDKNKDKKFIKDHFINDGFADCIIEENIDDELNKICDKYL